MPWVAVRRWLVAWVLLAPVTRAGAQASDSSHALSAFVLRVDNDLFALRGAGPPPDYDYTHGTTVALTLPRGRALTAFMVGQEIYTPRHNASVPVPGDRPHAAWLYGGWAAGRLSGRRLDSIAIRVGTTGPAALGEQLQNGVHRLLHNQLEQGWAHQLPARLAASISYDLASRLIEAEARQPSRFVAVALGGSTGTVRQELHAGVESYLGFGTPLVSSAAFPLVVRPGRWHVAAGYRESLVGGDIFVQGAGGVAGATLVPWVGEAYAAAGLRLERVGIEYRYTVRGPEYRAEPGSHAYGSIEITVFGHSGGLYSK